MQTTNTVVFWCRRSSVCTRFDQCHLNAEIFHFQTPAICQSTSILILYKYHMKCSIFIQSHRKCIDVCQSRMHHQNWFGGNYCGRRVSTLLRGELFSRRMMSVGKTKQVECAKRGFLLYTYTHIQSDPADLYRTVYFCMTKWLQRHQECV